MDYLIIVQGPDKGRQIPLGKSPLVIGRQRACDVVLNSPVVSRQHARILWADGRYYIEDLNTLGGTYVNDRQITERTPLEHRDHIRLGDVVLVVNCAEQVAETCIPSASPEKELDLLIDEQALERLREERIRQEFPLSALEEGLLPGTTDSLADTCGRRLGQAEQDLREAITLWAGLSRDDRFAVLKEKVRRELSSIGKTANDVPVERLRLAIELHSKSEDIKVPDAERARIVDAIVADLTTPIRDAVTCTVFAPPNASPGDSVLIQVFAHTLEQALAAAALAGECDAEAEQRGFKSLALPVHRGTALTCHLVMTGLQVDPALQELPWNGRPEAVQFAVTVPPDRRPGAVIGTVTVSQQGAPLGHIKFKLAILAEPRHEPGSRNEPRGDAAYRYRKAFVSYASADREEVLKRVQVLQRVGIDCFQDVLGLEPGSRWEQQLYRHIDESDLFLLFWSSEARRSHWVHEELRYALRRRGADEMAPPEIKPVVIEGPPPPPPPEELAHLHFNDYFLYLIAGQQGSAAQAARGANAPGR